MPKPSIPIESTSERFLQLFALSGFAIAQPLFEILARQTEFLIARGGHGSEILILTASLLLLPPMLLSLLEFALGLISRRAANGLHLIFVFALVFLIASAALVHREGLGSLGAVALASAAGAIVISLYLGSGVTRGLFRALSPAPIVLAVIFLTSEGVGALLRASPNAPGSAVQVRSQIPIVVIVLDELPLSSLLKGPREISSEYYPNFARMAETSTWYPKAVATGSHTTIALPILLTGKYPPEKPALPIRAHHPENLFSLLEASYAMHVVESRSLLYLSDREDKFDDGRVGPRRPTTTSLLADLSLIYLHLVAQESIRSGLPDISTTWGGFQRKPASSETMSIIDEATQERLFRRGELFGPVAAIRRFQRMIETAKGGRDFFFVHTSFPHAPWEYLPDGRRYSPTDEYTKRAMRWVTKPWWPSDAFRRHLLQTGYADQLLGEMIESLKTAGLYDEALVIVVADHGISFWPHQRVRVPNRHPHVEDIVNVPLFVKYPHQTTARVDDRVAESVDLLPTIAELLEIEVPWTLDGCSLLRRDCPELEKIRTYYASNHKIIPWFFAPAVLDRNETLERKFDLLGGGPNASSFYAFGPYSDWVGKSISSLAAGDGQQGIALLDAETRATLQSVDGRGLPVRFTAILQTETLSEDAPQIAIEVDGVIASIVPAPSKDGDDHRIAALLPPKMLGARNSSLKLYRIDGPLAAPTLHSLRLK